MDIISSTRNEKIKYVAALLKSKKERDSSGLFVIEGLRIFKDVLSTSPMSLKEIYVSESLAEKDRAEGLVLSSEESMAKTSSLKDRIYIVKDSVIESISGTVTPQGIICIAQKKQSSIKDLLTKKNRLLLLENIQDPGNLGTMLRTAEAAGMTGVILSEGCADIYNPKVIRSTMGSIFRVPFVCCEKFTTILRELKSRGVKIFAAYLHGGENYKDLSYGGDYAIMIGNEGSGLSEEAVGLSDKKIYIPMYGKIESLNAAVAAAVLMFH